MKKAKVILKSFSSWIILNLLSYSLYLLSNYGETINNYWIVAMSVIWFVIVLVLSFIIPIKILTNLKNE
jgi:hypothetical protein